MDDSSEVTLSDENSSFICQSNTHTHAHLNTHVTFLSSANQGLCQNDISELVRVFAVMHQSCLPPNMSHHHQSWPCWQRYTVWLQHTHCFVIPTECLGSGGSSSCQSEEEQHVSGLCLRITLWFKALFLKHPYITKVQRDLFRTKVHIIQEWFIF